MNIRKIEKAVRENWNQQRYNPSVEKILITIYKARMPIWLGEFHVQSIDEYNAVFIKSGQFAAWLRKQVQKLIDEGADSFKIELDRAQCANGNAPHTVPI